MPLETTNYITGLDTSWPQGGDPTNKGDDHLRLIKHVLVTQFPGALGQGFDKAITATEDEINYLGGLTSNAQSQFNALDARVTTLEGVLIATPGTVMPFYQAAAPLGWTKVVTDNDKMMRIVSGTGGVAGGTDSPILMNKVPTHNHTATNTAESTAHTHTFSDTSTYNSVSHTHSGTTTTNGNHTHKYGKMTEMGDDADWRHQELTTDGSQFDTDAAGNHNHTITTGNQSASHTHDVSGTTSAMSANATHNHTITVDNNAGSSNWTPKYMDFIIASKD